MSVRAPSIRPATTSPTHGTPAMNRPSSAEASVRGVSVAPAPPPASGKWSWSLGRIAGIDVRLHGTFLLLLAWLVFKQVGAGNGLRAASSALLTVLVVFAVIVLHELGHALTARRFGIKTRDITLYPMGGVASLERMPKVPRQELLVALAGPAVNLVLALSAVAAILALHVPWSPAGLAAAGAPWLAKFFWLNVGIGVFNLLPAFPMDGGRALRAFLAMRMSHVRATDYAARIGRWMAIGFGVLGIFANPMLVVIAVFVWFGATTETAMVHTSAALEAATVRDAMVTTFETLPAFTTVAAGVERAMHTMQRYFPVFEGNRLVGFVSTAELVRKATEGGMGALVGSLASPIGPTAKPGDALDATLARFSEEGVSLLPVMESGQLFGLLFAQNILQLAGLRDGYRANAEAAIHHS